MQARSCNLCATGIDAIVFGIVHTVLHSFATNIYCSLFCCCGHYSTCHSPWVVDRGVRQPWCPTHTLDWPPLMISALLPSFRFLDNAENVLGILLFLLLVKKKEQKKGKSGHQ